MKKVRSDTIIRALSKINDKNIFLTEVKNGPTWFSNDLVRFDAVSIKPSWTKPCVTIFEVKVDRQDFTRDEKWPYYKQFCHKLYFACPTGLITPDELSQDVGLVYLNPETNALSTKKAAKFRDIEMPWEMFYYIVLSRLGDKERHPFFSSRREQLEAWVEDKHEREELGIRVASKMAKAVKDLKEKNNGAETMIKKLEAKVKRYDEVREELKGFGVDIEPRRWETGQWKEDLRSVMLSKCHPDVPALIEGLGHALDRLKIAVMYHEDKKEIEENKAC